MEQKKIALLCPLCEHDNIKEWKSIYSLIESSNDCMHGAECDGIFSVVRQSEPHQHIKMQYRRVIQELQVLTETLLEDFFFH